MSVKLRERKWCGVLKIKKVNIEGYWMVKTITNGLTLHLSRWCREENFAISSISDKILPHGHAKSGSGLWSENSLLVVKKNMHNIIIPRLFQK